MTNNIVSFQLIKRSAVACHHKVKNFLVFNIDRVPKKVLLII